MAQQVRQDHVKVLAMLNELNRRKEEGGIRYLYPDEGPLRKELYEKHLEFFEAGAKYRARCVMAGNGIGKTFGLGGAETVYHATGDYPSWWKGKRFLAPIKAWACGDTKETVKENIQTKLLGDVEDWGTGLIPKDKLDRKPRTSRGDSEAVEVIYVKHVSGGVSQIRMKSYEQGWKAFTGTERELIWLDEEPPPKIYAECAARTRTVGGHLLLTFTPLKGLSETALLFVPRLNPDMNEDQMHLSGRYCIHIGWESAPHLSEEDKKFILDNSLPHERAARQSGIPSVGAGAIYPIEPEFITVAPFQVPDFWPRVYGLDVGWNRTAAIWGAHDLANDCVYLYHEYYRAHAEPEVHAAAINAPGAWIPGVIDPASRSSGQKDGKKLYPIYKKGLGLNLSIAENNVEAGIFAVWERLSSSRLKVFSNCMNWIAEFHLYQRDEKGKIKKTRDHLMDATKYLILSGLKKAQISNPSNNTPSEYNDVRFGSW